MISGVVVLELSVFIYSNSDISCSKLKFKLNLFIFQLMVRNS